MDTGASVFAVTPLGWEY